MKKFFVFALISAFVLSITNQVKACNYESSSLRNRQLMYAAEGRSVKPMIGVAGRYVIMQRNVIYSNSPSRLKHLRHEERIAAYNAYRQF